MTILSTNTKHQQLRLLAYLLASPITTTEARQILDIMHPAARIQELRELGHNIITFWQTVDTGKAKHRVARYVLLNGGNDG
ncbi:helix-turn-helix domain-containing protein [Methyloglobulus sp.]|uniref:helix-turn-helix domain-containing protein n=1 Tax=Methyloglobulus sp. TaxID=2518622 RepID=UPI0032B7DBAD